MAQSPKSATSAAQSETDLVAAILLRFDRNWSAGQLEAFAAEISNWSAELRHRTLALLVKIDMERRWQTGQPLNVEQYLSRFADLGTVETVAPELLLAEWEARRQRGETPRFGDFSRRFPQQAPALQQLLQQAESGESVARGEASASVSHRETPRPSRVSTASISPAKLSLNSASAPSLGTASRRELSGRFGKYEIRRRLGKGGMGEVYLAYDPKADREVAVKIPQFADEESADVIQRFYREVRVAATIQHPNICPIWEVDEVNGVPYLAMPFIQGETLDARMKKRTKPLDERTIAQLIRKLAMALSEAHRLGITHRDLKPANIMFDHRKEPIVMDFGLARRAGQAESKLTKSGMIVGTPAYMPIEQVQAQDELIGPASDVYSLGVILYELLTGRLPFDGPALSVLALILTAQPDAPRNLRSDVDLRLEAICLKAIAKQPADRYQSMTEFAAALGDYLKSASAPSPAGDVSPSVQSSTVANVASEPTMDHRTEAPFEFPVFSEDESPATTVIPTALKKTPSHSLKTTVLISAQQVRTRWSRLPFAAQVVALCAGFGFLLGVILWFRSGDALVKVEVHSEDVEVKFNNETLKLTDGPHEYKVSPGDHTLHIKSGNAEFDTEIFTLKKGANPAVTVELVKGEIVAMHGKKTIRRQSLSTQKSKVSDKSNATASRSPSNGSSALSSQPANAPGPAIAPFDAAQARKHQEAWAGYLKVPVEFENSLGMKLRLIPPGEFLMGAGPDDSQAMPDEVPQHTVQISRPFHLGVYEVTQEEYEKVTGANPSFFGKQENLGGDIDTKRWPVEQVTWDDAVKFCERLSAMPKESEAGRSYRLPTEAEWEYASRAGTTTLFTYGTSLGSAQANFNGAYQIPRTTTGPWLRHPEIVGKYPANALGLFDMLGNVWEWCGDSKRTYEAGTHLDPRGPANGPRVNRGGGWISSAGECRSSHRRPDNLRPEDRHRSTGLRVVCVVPVADPQTSMKSETSLKTDYDAIATGKWVRIVDSSTPLSNPERMKFNDGVLELNDVALNLPNVIGRDLIVRGKVKKVSGQVAGIRLRDNGQGRIYGFWFNGGNWFGIGKTGQRPWAGLTEGRVGPLQSDFFEMAASVVGDSLSLYVNGTRIYSVRDSELINGSVTLATGGGKSLFKDVEVMVLDAVPAASATPVSPATTPTAQVRPADAPAPAIAPFDAAQAKKHQEEWAAYLKVPVEYTNSIGMKFRLIPPGEFMMGNAKTHIDATLKKIPSFDTTWQQFLKGSGPRHTVILTEPYFVSIYEVTQSNYETVLQNNPSAFSTSGKRKQSVVGINTSNHPVEGVSWNDAIDFCCKLSLAEELKPAYSKQAGGTTIHAGNGYRLPTEAKWELACRAGTTTTFWSGDRIDDLLRIGWMGINSAGRTHAVGERPSNPFGLFDFHGNVWEWCEDVWDPTYYASFTEGPAVNPPGSTTGLRERMMRGGAFDDRLSPATSADRYGYVPSTCEDSIGFRVTLSVEAVLVAANRKTENAPANARTTSKSDLPVDVPKPAIAAFDAAQAKKHQDEWAAYLKVPVEVENSIGLKTVLIPPGEFTMGRMPGEAARFPRNGLYQEPATTQHKVTLTRPFRMSTTEVTRRQWREVMGSEPWRGKDPGPDGDDYPANYTSKPAAKDFCKRLSEKEGKTYRLPTEAEWEFACRAGSETLYFFGEDRAQVGEYACLGRLQAVATKKPNRWGLFDMYGNLWEWVADGRTSFTAEAAVDPLLNPGDEQSIIRGSCFRSAIPAEFSSGARHAWPGGLPTDEKGFRVVCEVDQGTVVPAGAGTSNNSGGGTKNTTKKSLSSSKSTAKSADAFQSGSEWVSDNGYQHLTVLDRKGGTFLARFRNQATVEADKVDREVSGTIKDNKVTWLAKDVRPTKGGPGGDNFGTLKKDAIDFRWSDKSGGSGTFTLRLKPVSK